MVKPKISILIPVYRVEKYIERCARSLFEQTLYGIEYIFIDDCTPDRSIEILRCMVEEYSSKLTDEEKSVKIVRMPTNSGLPAVRRYGLQLAEGEYIAHCDSDDWVDVTMYQKLYERAIEDDSDIVVTGYKETDSSSILMRNIHCFSSKKEYISNMLYAKESWAVWDKLCKRELYNGIEFSKYNMGEDMVLTFQLVLKANKISNVEECLYNYFFNSESITKTNSAERRYSNWKQSVYNTKKIISFLSDSQEACLFHNEMLHLKYVQKRLAGNLAYHKMYSREWIETFSSVNIIVYKLKSISFIEKVKFYLLMGAAWIRTIL